MNHGVIQRDTEKEKMKTPCNSVPVVNSSPVKTMSITYFHQAPPLKNPRMLRQILLLKINRNLAGKGSREWGVGSGVLVRKRRLFLTRLVY